MLSCFSRLKKLVSKRRKCLTAFFLPVLTSILDHIMKYTIKVIVASLVLCAFAFPATAHEVADDILEEKHCHFSDFDSSLSERGWVEHGETASTHAEDDDKINHDIKCDNGELQTITSAWKKIGQGVRIFQAFTVVSFIVIVVITSI